MINIEKQNHVGIITLQNPANLNALSPAMLDAIASAYEQLDIDTDVRVLIITGSNKVFAAGADIKTMSTASSEDMQKLDTLQYWKRMRKLSKPIIAAVSGYAFGGGCELALQCDIIIASETAKFAQSEINVGIMPGAGGTQRLAKAIGPYKAMEMILTGDPISAEEAFQYNLVNRVVPAESYLQEAILLAEKIAQKPRVAIEMARKAVKVGVESTLAEGLIFEREHFISLFDTPDQEEGMKAFLEKRKPNFNKE